MSYAQDMDWLVSAGGLKSDKGTTIVVDDDGYSYITGEFRDHCFFNGIDLNNYGGPAGRDCFVAKMTKDGDWIWAKRAG